MPNATAAVRHNQRLTHADLRQEAAAAAEASGRTQYQIAEELGVSPGSLSKALNNEGGRYLKLQARIIDHLTGYRVEGPIYRAVRKGDVA